MRIGLIDVDGQNKFPNLALMKLSAYHKMIGDMVEWYMPFSPTYDRVYCSKVFSFTPNWQDSINAKEVYYGGTGYQIQLKNGKEIWNENPKVNGIFCKELPIEAEFIYPDYSLYPSLTQDTAYGFLTRGCPRGCSFCHVQAKEGKNGNYYLASVDMFYKGQGNIVLLDPNILACSVHSSLLEQLADTKAYVDFSQGLDARLLNDENCKLLSRLKIKNIHFAWDRYKDGKIILPKLKMFSEYKYKDNNPNHSAIVYTLVNFDTTLEQDLERIYTLRDMGYWAYVMIYDKQHASKEIRYLQRWCNNRRIFAKIPNFKDYIQK